MSIIAWYRLNDAAGPAAIDSIGGFDGAYGGDPSFAQATIPSGISDPAVTSVELNTSGDYVAALYPSVAESGLQVPVAAGALMLWLKVNAGLVANDVTDAFVLSTTREIIFESTPFTVGGPGIRISQDVLADTRTVQAVWTQNDGATILATTAATLDYTHTGFYHFAVVWDVAANQLDLHWFEDTSPSASGKVSLAAGTLEQDAAAATDLQSVSMSPSTALMPVYALDLKCYDAVLSDAEVATERDQRDYTPAEPTTSTSADLTGLPTLMQHQHGHPLTLTWVSGAYALNLTDATLTGTIYEPFVGARAITGDLVVSDAEAGQFTWTPSAADTASAGDLQVVFKADFNGAIAYTFRTALTVKLNPLIGG